MCKECVRLRQERADFRCQKCVPICADARWLLHRSDLTKRGEEKSELFDQTIPPSNQAASPDRRLFSSETWSPLSKLASNRRVHFQGGESLETSLNESLIPEASTDVESPQQQTPEKSMVGIRSLLDQKRVADKARKNLDVARRLANKVSENLKEILGHETERSWTTSDQ
jgi:hypothetical protein